MLNEKNERELAYIVKVDSVTEMNADRLECAHIGGWHCVVGKNEFKKDDYAVYFEIDSKLPEVYPFNTMEFLMSKHYKIKSQKIRGEVSQGLLVSLNSFIDDNGNKPKWLIDVEENISNGIDVTNTFLTKELDVTYSVFEDNSRKSSSMDKYKKMAQRNRKFATKSWWKWLYKREWGKKILFFFFGKKRDIKTAWPDWVVKTDEERVQNMPFLFTSEEFKNMKWMATEKIDGTSTTFTLKRKGRKKEFYVCSRNVVFNTPEKPCFYDTNVYLEMNEKYHMREVLEKALDYFDDIEFVTIQGETYGGSIQKRDYGEEHRLAIFNVIFGFKSGEVRRLNPVDMDNFLIDMHIDGVPLLEPVPIIDIEFTLPDTCEELLEIATGKSMIDNGMREGLVFRSYDGTKSFKAVSNEFLLKYHAS